MRPTLETVVYLNTARIYADSAQAWAAIGRWDVARLYVSTAGDYMKKVKWEIVK